MRPYRRAQPPLTAAWRCGDRRRRRGWPLRSPGPSFSRWPRRRLGRRSPPRSRRPRHHPTTIVSRWGRRQLFFRAAGEPIVERGDSCWFVCCDKPADQVTLHWTVAATLPRSFNRSRSRRSGAVIPIHGSVGPDPKAIQCPAQSVTVVPRAKMACREQPGSCRCGRGDDGALLERGSSPRRGERLGGRGDAVIAG